MLIENRIHRLPVIDPETGDLFAILNQKPLLKFLFNAETLQDWLRPEWLKFYDASFVDDRLIATLLG